MPIKQIDFGSKEYQQMLNLRQEILRTPLQLSLGDEDLGYEKNAILIAALDDDIMLGCCVLTPHEKHVIQLRQMAVQGNLQGKGIGATLMNYAENISRDKGYKKLMMHARKSAVGFYEKLGYKISSDEFSEVTVPHLIMEKKLDFKL